MYMDVFGSVKLLAAPFSVTLQLLTMVDQAIVVDDAPPFPTKELFPFVNKLYVPLANAEVV